jgi:carbon monoxide dehydrogenase subunit G
MSTWRSEIDVRAEPERVLDTLTDVDACAAWSPVGFDVDELESPRLRTGTNVTVSGAVAGRRVRFRVEIVRADRERLVLHAAGPVVMVVHYVVSRAAHGSRVRAAISLAPGRGRGAVVAARATAILLHAGALEHALTRLAREAERGHLAPEL